MSTYPTFEQLVDNPPNPERLLVLTPAYRSFLSLLVVFILSIVLVVLINMAIYQMDVGIVSDILRHFPARWLALVPLLILLELIRRKYNQLYIFGIDKATHKNGIISLHYNETVIEYGDVRAIHVIQDFWGRIFNYGTLEVGTAAQEDSELILDGIVSTEELSEIVDQMRTYSRELNLKHESVRTNE